MRTNTRASSSGRKLYDEIWTMLNGIFIDEKRLHDWDSWRYRFDELITSKESAMRFASEMIASLNDNYTELVVKPSAVAATRSEQTSDVATTATASQPDVVAMLSPSKIGYVRIRSFDREDLTELMAVEVAKIAECTGVILDLRSNSGGRMQQALECCGFFLREGLLGSTELRHPQGLVKRKYFVNEGQFYQIETMPDGTTTTNFGIRQKPILAGKPIVLIINGRTASASELMVAAIVQNGEVGKVHMVGSGVTPGKGIGQAEFDLRYNKKAALRITRVRWLAPGGDWVGDCGQTVSNGIEPDTMVENDRGPEALKVASDELKKMLGLAVSAT